MKSSGQKIRHYNSYQKQGERRSQKPVPVPVGLRGIDDGFRLDLLNKRLGPADLFLDEGVRNIPVIFQMDQPPLQLAGIDEGVVQIGKFLFGQQGGLIEGKSGEVIAQKTVVQEKR